VELTKNIDIHKRHQASLNFHALPYTTRFSETVSEICNTARWINELD